jgi:hypothetical protein
MNDEQKQKVMGSMQSMKDVAKSGNQDALMSMGGSDCMNPELTSKFLDLAQKGGDALASIQSAIDPSKASTDSELYLKSEYERAKRVRQNADLDFYVAEQNYFVNIKGSDSYKSLVTERIKNTGDKEYEATLKDFIQMNEIASILITTANVRDVAEENMKRVVDELEKNNDRLHDIINSGKGDAVTYQRKSSYESKMKEKVEDWSVIPMIIYWTLIILWIGIVMVYLKQITLVNSAILVGLILYPFLSTKIVVWVLGLIQSVWNFIFSAVKNRVTA